MLQAQVPGVPPLVLCAKALPPLTVDSDALLNPQLELMKGLLDVGIIISSHSCDGTEAECKLQAKLTAKANSFFKYAFTHPADGSDFEISLPLFDGHPIVMMQDLKHLLKTFRNNAFSGAHALILGDYHVTYHQFCNLAFPPSPLPHDSTSPNPKPLPPLFLHDVEKDRSTR